MNRLWTWITALVVFLAIGGMGSAILALEHPTGTLTGTVLSQDKRPLAHAKVSALGPVKLSVETDDKGQYRIERIRVGTYQVFASLKGYERQWQSPEVTIREGKTTERINFALVAMRPAVHFAQYQRVFTPKEPLRLSFRGTLVNQVHVALYRTSLPHVLNLRDGDAARKASPGHDETLISEWDQPIPADARDEDDWFYRHLALKEQPEGLYRVFMQGSGEFNGKPYETERQATWFNVSHVGVVTKRAPDQVLAYAVDLTTKQPLSGVQLSQASRSSERSLGTTDRNGLLQGAALATDGPIVGRHAGAVAVVNLFGVSERQRLAGYVYTDRPIYRPAQTVHVKAVLRDRDGKRYRVPAGAGVTLTVTDSGGDELYKRALTVSQAGSVDDSFTLGAQPNLGEYTAAVEWGKASVEQTFQVKAYRKPEFRVEIQPNQRQLIQGETLTANVSATYYFGAPVAGQNVRYTVYRAQSYPWMNEEDWFYSQYSGGTAEYDWGYGEVVSSGEARTDDAGHLTISVPTTAGVPTEPRHPYDATAEYRYTVEVETTDQTNRVVTTREAVTVAPAAMRLQAEPTRYVHAPGESIEIRLQSRRLDDQPVATQGEAILYRIIPAELDENGEPKGNDTYEQVQTVAFATDSHGLGTVAVKAPSAGSFLLAAHAFDGSKREVVTDANLWITADGGDGSSYRSAGIQLVFDKKRYAIGETATVFVARPRPGLPILLTVEGDRIHQAQVLRGSGPSATVKLPVTATFSPNAFVAVAAVDGKAFHSAERSLNVLPVDQFLTVSVTTDRKRYKPGETAVVTVETKDHRGRGVPAEVSLGVVDQAIYALAPDATPDPRMVFHGPRGNEVTTAYSFSEDYSGGADKDAANPRVRKKFLDTAAWFPSLQTGASGKTVVQVPLPDNLTTWVITARAHTLDTKVGTDRQSFLATQDLLVRLATPRFMVEGDQLTLIGLIHNYLPSAAKLKTSLAAIGLAIGGTTEGSADVASNSVEKQTFAVSAEKVGQATLTYKAAGSAGGDALEQSFPVLAHGSLDVTAKAGEITDRLEQTIEIPGQTVPGTASLALELTPTPLGAVSGALAYLRNYPYGCIEQTLNRFVPELIAGPLVDAHIDEQRLKEGIERITALQHHDGGWGWWSADDSTPTLTAYTLLALKEARTAGLAVPDRLPKQGTDFLVRGLPNLGFDKVSPSLIERGGGPDEQALVLHALSAWGINRTVELNRLTANQTGLSAQGLAHLAEAQALAGDIGAARKLIETLDAQAVTSETMAQWQPREAQPWFQDPIEATADVVRAMVHISPDDPRIDQAVRFLLRERRGSHWQSTKDTGATVLALAEVSRRQGPAPNALPITIKLDGNVLAQTDLSDGDAWRLGYRLDVPTDKLTAGTHALTIERGDTDGGPLPYSWSRSAMVRADKLDAKPRQDLTIKRQYRLLTSAVREAKAGSDFSRWFNPKQAATLPGATSGLLPGDLILVELTIDAKKPRAFAMIEDPLPAGFEVVPDRGEDLPWTYWWTHSEVRDDKVAFFMRRLPAGTQSLYYVLRPEIPGRVRALPPEISEMYAPDVRARDAETTLSVGG
jgi:uncharacterized protein YfaS (alpha-2-macroglobulin family)